MIGCYFSSYRP
uniref:Uncharacterized protein n=1 Tax=Arundo donax TaxID=35708 RepID=A0A0A8YVU3_ARUDO